MRVCYGRLRSGDQATFLTPDTEYADHHKTYKSSHFTTRQPASLIHALYLCWRSVAAP